MFSRRFDRFSISASVILTAVAASAVWAAPRPNIVLMISDDQDGAHLGFMGHPVVQTPALDRLAEAGTVFTLAHLPMSRCRPTLAGFLSGRWPHQSGIYFNYGPGSLDPVNSLPNLLVRAGYATHFSGKYWEGDVRRMGFTHGTDTTRNTFVRQGQEGLFSFIDEVGGKQPFFVWWAPKMPHMPHNPPDEYKQRFDLASIPVPDWFAGSPEDFRQKELLSFAMEAWLDDGVDRFVGKLKAEGLYDNTMFVFLTDNGWCNGLISKGSPFEKGVHTPILFTLPGTIPSGQRFDHLVSTMDVYPTILDYAGVKIPATAAGRSLRPLIEGRPAELRDVLYGAIYPAYATIPGVPNKRSYPTDRGDGRPERDVYALYARTKKWKYILFVQDVVHQRNDTYFRIKHRMTDFPERARGDEDLYDIESDRYELHDLADLPEHRQRLDQFKNQVLDWWRHTGGRPLGQFSKAVSVRNGHKQTYRSK